ncbi:MAG: glutamate formimidoyltransferase [Pelolinea sp.]|nr:glutamate formimidoyltransferase [Pelolinea sp.]
MPMPLVECIPNYSEGRRSEVVDQIIAAILSVPEVQILDRHSDADHNRTVLTLLGVPEAVKESVFRSIAKAAELIDMDQHQGEHPRIGATDVVPFVPIRDISMADCVELARQLGNRVGTELGIPVYLYEDAATSPERVNLENIRKGQYEGLKEEIITNPNRKPDYGPAKLGKAGAVVIGAREALIAFNVYLTTEDESIAKKIAKIIRYSSGGLRFVKAMGVLVDGRAQVSMNLTNYRKTPIAMVVETIRREAKRNGVAIHHSELVGLVPQEALVDAAVWYTQLDQFEPSQVLENHLGQPQNEDNKYSFLDELASEAPTPGGGSAAAFTAAQAAALAAMVARLTIGKKKYAEVEADMRQVLEKAESLRKKLTLAITEDAQAFEAVMAAMKLPKTTPEDIENRNSAIQSSYKIAAETPLKTAEFTLEVLELLKVAGEKGNVNAITDAGTGGALAMAALAGAGANVRINLLPYAEDSHAQSILARLVAVEKEMSSLYLDIKKALKDRAKITLL